MDPKNLPKVEGLQDPLVTESGTPVQTARDWQAQRTHYLTLAETWLWGAAPEDITCEGTVVASHPLYDGKAVLETIRIAYGPGRAWCFYATLLRPGREGCFPAITWNLFETAFLAPCPIEEEAIDRGYILVGFDKEQLMYDIRPTGEAAKEAFPGYSWNAIRIWAWGHSLLATYLLTRPDVHPDQLVATGHSRGGKAALAAAATDLRFSVCAPINSGAGGCGCFRFLGDDHGLTQDPTTVESMSRVGQAFPHWWTEAFLSFSDPTHPDAMGMEAHFPFDLHILKALIAPRGLISCEALQDTWANPYGSYLTWKAAQPVFDLLGAPDRNAIFYRQGGHFFGAEDWRAVLDFCDEVFFGKATAHAWNRPPYAT